MLESPNDASSADYGPFIRGFISRSKRKSNKSEQKRHRAQSQGVLLDYDVLGRSYSYLEHGVRENPDPKPSIPCSGCAKSLGPFGWLGSAKCP